MFATVASIGVSALGAYSGRKSAKKAAKAAKKRGRANYALIMDETREEVRRANLMNERQRTNYTNIIGASGVSAKSGTVRSTYRNMINEQDRQVDWTKRAGEQRAKVAKMQASYVAGQAKAQGKMAMYSGLGNIATAAVNEWG